MYNNYLIIKVNLLQSMYDLLQIVCAYATPPPSPQPSLKLIRTTDNQVAWFLFQFVTMSAFCGLRLFHLVELWLTQVLVEADLFYLSFDSNVFILYFILEVP